MFYRKKIYVFLSMRSRIIIPFILLLLIGCKSENDTQRYNFDFPENILVLGHKGSGTKGEFGNSFHDNSIAGILNAIAELDGAEFDLQMSLDSTLWLFHDHVMLDCNGNLVNIATITDSSIEAYGACNYSSEIDRFEDLVKALDKLKDTTKALSMDLKVLQNPESIKTFGGKAELALFVAERINILLLEKHNYQVFIEVAYSSQVDIMESITGKTTFLIHNSFEYLRETIRMNHSAPIHHFYMDVPQLFDRYGEKSQVWVVNSANEMMNALTLRPSAIQTDNIPMVQFFRALPTRGIVSETLRIAPPIEKTDFVMIKEFMAPIQEDVLFEIELNGQQLEGVQIVFSAVDAQGIAKKWEALPITKNINHFFQGTQEHSALQTKSYKLYLWNADGNPIEVTQSMELRIVQLD